MLYIRYTFRYSILYKYIIKYIFLFDFYLDKNDFHFRLLKIWRKIFLQTNSITLLRLKKFLFINSFDDHYVTKKKKKKTLVCIPIRL